MFRHVPGQVIYHHPRFRGSYIGSPSICVLSPTEYLVSHDIFGPTSNELTNPITRIWRTTDAGISWYRQSVVAGAFWSRLFHHRGDLYLFGTNKQYGDVVIRRSRDNGCTWSEPVDAASGVLACGQFHMAPTPVVEHDGVLYLALDRADGPVQEWGKRFGAALASVPVGADLLDATMWSFSKASYYNPAYLHGQFEGWLEGSVVIGPNAAIQTLMRVENDSTYVERAALLTYDRVSGELTCTAEADFVEFPGGSKKFTVRYDTDTATYLALTNVICEPARNIYQTEPDYIRNTVALIQSKDLRSWQICNVVLQTPDIDKTAFQYIDFAIVGDDIVFVSRTAASDWYGGAHSFHDANFLTFHRIPQFRDLLI